MLLLLLLLQIQEVGKSRNKRMREMFLEFKQPICKFIVDAMHEGQSRNPPAKDCLDIVSEVASVFEFRDVQAFLTVC